MYIAPVLSSSDQFFTQLSQFVIVGRSECRRSLLTLQVPSLKLNTGRQKCTRPRESDNLLSTSVIELSETALGNMLENRDSNGRRDGGVPPVDQRQRQQRLRNVSQAFLLALRHCGSVFLIRFDRCDRVARGEAIITAFALRSLFSVDKPTSYGLSAKFSRRAVDYRVRPGDRRTMFA